MLMAAAIDGDESAYRQLLRSVSRSMRGQVRRGLLRAGRPGSDVEDVVQEVLLAVHLKRHTWTRGRPVGPWLSAIARHKLVDHLRRRDARVHISIDDLAAVPQEDEPQVEATGEQVDRLLRTLSDRQRAVVRAVSVEGLSIAETARRFDISEGAVRVALHRGLKALASTAGEL